MLTLIDGNSLLFRAYYGVHSHLTRSDGTPTGAVYGFFNMILPILAAAKPGDIFVCVFDASRKTFRQDIYPGYKANRDETPADLISQSVLIQTGMSELGMPVLSTRRAPTRVAQAVAPSKRKVSASKPWKNKR